jgi:hypothetical protein
MASGETSDKDMTFNQETGFGLRRFAGADNGSCGFAFAVDESGGPPYMTSVM